MKRFGGFFLTLLLIINLTSTAFAEDATHTPTETLPGSGNETSAPERPSISPGSSGSNLGMDYLDYCTELGMKNLAIMYANNMGYVLDSVGNETMASWFYAAAVELGYVSWEDYVKAHHNSSTGQLELTKGFAEAFNVEINNYLQEMQGWYIEPATTQNRKWLLNHMKYYSNVTDGLSVLQPIFEDTNNGFLELMMFDRQTWNGYGCFLEYADTVSRDVYFIKKISNPSMFPDGFGFSLYDADLNPVAMDSVVTGQTRDYGVSYRMDGAIQNYCNSRIAYYVFFEDTKIFSSLEALNNYLYGQQSIYIMSDISSRLVEMTINVEQFQYDWGKANEKSLAAIIAAIEKNKTELNVDTLTEKQLQDVINATLSARLQDIAMDIASLNDANSQQNALIYEKLEQIYQLLRNWYDDDLNRELNGGGSSDVVASTPGSFLDGLDEHLDSVMNNFYEEHILSILRDLFVPDQETLDYTMSNIETNLPFIAAGRDFVGFVKAALAEDLEPVIYFGAAPSMDRFVHESQNKHTPLYPVGSFGTERPTLPDRDGESGGHTALDHPAAFSSESPASVDVESQPGEEYVRPESSGIVADNLGTDCLAFDFSWYEPYRFTVQRIIAGFIWIYLLWYIFRKSPRIIDGSAEFITFHRGD